MMLPPGMLVVKFSYALLMSLYTHSAMRKVRFDGLDKQKIFTWPRLRR